MKVRIKSILKTVLYFPKDYLLHNQNTFKNKRFIHQYLENISWSIINQDYLSYYFIANINKKNRSIWEYISLRKFNEIRKKKNIVDFKRQGYLNNAALRNKLFFSIYMKECNIPSVEVLEEIVLHESKLINEVNLDYNFPTVLKSKDGIQGDNIYFTQSTDTKEKVEPGSYIVQKVLEQHDLIDRIYNKSINTIRVITIYAGNEIKILTCFQRIGTSVSRNVDNWSAGGLIIPIDLRTGKYYNFGLLSDIYMKSRDVHISKINSHPDTNYIFKITPVPYFKEMIEIVKDAHKVFNDVQSIGWDIVITDDGPIILEGNDDWGLKTAQIVKGGLKEFYNSLL